MAEERPTLDQFLSNRKIDVGSLDPQNETNNADHRAMGIMRAVSSKPSYYLAH